MTPYRDSTLWERFKAFSFHLFPHHALSRLTYCLARLDTSLKNPLVEAYIRFFKVDMQEAEFPNPGDYPSFNDFFTRKLKDGVHKINTNPSTLISPCDGTVTQIGKIEQGTLMQAKGRYYGVEELLGGNHPQAHATAEEFINGGFCSMYLSPRDYHRVHAPADVRLKTMAHIPGRLFSVAAYAPRTIPRLYVRNERVACIFESDLGAIAVVMVGALNVGSIETTWHGVVTPSVYAVTRVDYSQDLPAREVDLGRGEELGRFNLGSCVIVLTSNPELSWNPACAPGKHIRMGDELGCIMDKNTVSEQSPGQSSGQKEPTFKLAETEE